MRISRGILCTIGLSVLIPQGALRAGIVVKTHYPVTTRNYWIVRNEDLRRLLALTPNATVESVVLKFGRRPINGLPLPTKANVRYTVYPECRGRMDPDGELADGGQPSVWVDC